MNLLNKGDNPKNEENEILLDKDKKEIKNKEIEEKQEKGKISFKMNFEKVHDLLNLDVKDVQVKLSNVIKKISYQKRISQKRKIVAFDIGSGSIKIAEGMYCKNKLSIKKLIRIRTPLSSIEDGKIINDKLMIKKIKNVLRENSIKSKYAICTSNSTAIINREIIIPLVKEEELETVVAFEIQQYLPINLDDYILQITILDTIEKENKMQVRVIAYPKNIARGYYELLKKLELKPYALDVNYNALNKLTNYISEINNYEINRDESIAFIDMGTSSIDVNIYNDEVLKFTRIIKAGESYLDDILKDILSLETNEIESYKKNEIDLTSYELSNQNTEVLREIDEWIEKIEKILQFYKNKNNGAEISRVFIYGGASKIKGMAEYLTTKLSINTNCIENISDLNFKYDEDNMKVNDFVNVIGSIIRL